MAEETGDPFYEWDNDAADPIPEVLRPYARRRYIKVNSLKISYGEYWRLSPGPITFIFVAIARALGIRMHLASGIPYPDELVHIERNEMSLRADEQMMPQHRACTDLGFTHGFWYTVPLLGDQEGYAAVLLGPDSETVAHVIYSRVTTNEVTEEKAATVFVSRFDDGQLWGTTDQKRELDSPPNFIGSYNPRVSVKKLFDTHRDRVAKRRESSVSRIARDGLHQFVIDLSQEETDFHLKRGVYEFLDRDEFEELLEAKLAELGGTFAQERNDDGQG